MAIKAKSNKQPWWAKIILLIFFIVNLLIVGMVKQIGLLKPLKGMETIAAYIIFGQISGLLVGLIIYLFYRGAQAYDNKGAAIDRSHIWVNARTGRKVSDASIKNVYEKLHGSGSWKKKVEKERGCVTVFAIIAAVVLSIFGFYYLSFRVKLPLLISVQMLLDSNPIYWISWVVLALLGGFAVFMIYLAFWDLVHYHTSFAVSPTGLPMGFQDDPPSLSIILPKAIALILAVLLNIAVLIYTFWPSLRAAPIGKHYTNILFLTYLVSGLLWFFGVLLQDVQESREYRQQQDLKNKKKALEESVEKFFGKDTDRKERLISGLLLLGNRESLTYDGKKGIVEVLKAISGENYGTDYGKWEDWIMKQLMK